MNMKSKIQTNFQSYENENEYDYDYENEYDSDESCENGNDGFTKEELNEIMKNYRSKYIDGDIYTNKVTKKAIKIIFSFKSIHPLKLEKLDNMFSTSKKNINKVLDVPTTVDFGTQKIEKDDTSVESDTESESDDEDEDLSKIIKKSPPKISPSFENKKSPQNISPSFENKKYPPKISPSFEKRTSYNKSIKNKEIDINGVNFPDLSSKEVYKEEKKEQEKKEEEWIEVNQKKPNEEEEEWFEVKQKKLNEKEERNKAFDILSDKNKIDSKLNRTKICFSVSKGIKCPHTNCRFAHSKEQLMIASCLFKDCRFVKKNKQNLFTNVSKTKICNYKHTNESLENYYSRAGINDSFSIRKL